MFDLTSGRRVRRIEMQGNVEGVLGRDFELEGLTLLFMDGVSTPASSKGVLHLSVLNYRLGDIRHLLYNYSLLLTTAER